MLDQIEKAWDNSKDDEEIALIAIKFMPILLEVAKAVKNLPWGSHVALPWCRESFPELDEAMKLLEKCEPARNIEANKNP